MRRALPISAFVLAVACGPPGDAPLEGPGGWRGTVETEGDVTAVHTVAPAWSGPARLVEELSIGVEEGDAPYLFGNVRGVAASDDAIYVADTSVPVVRRFTAEGTYVGDLGREGSGPGEYTYPGGIVVTDDGRVLVHDRRGIHVYGPEGEALETLRVPRTFGVPMLVTADGTPYGVTADPDATYWRVAQAVVRHGPGGPVGEERLPPRYPIEPPWTAEPRSLPVPHAPQYVWAMTLSGALVGGAGDEYRFTVEAPDGGRLVVSREWEPVALSDEEHRVTTRRTSLFLEGVGDTWTGPPVPRTKPAFVKFMPTRSGEIWVVRPGPSERQPASECSSGSTGMTGACWRETWLVDAFDAEGRFLGPVDMPEGRTDIGSFATDHGGPFAYVRGDRVWMPVEGEDGVIRVKRYRLVPPDAS